MFYVLSRFFTLLSSPVIYIFLLLVTAVFVSGRRLRYFCVWGALFLFLLFTNRWVYQQAEEWWTGSTLSSVESASRNTRENAQFVARMIPGLSDGPFLLITSAVHMRCSLASFREVGLRPDYYSTDRYERPYRRWENWIPDPRLFKEWYGLGHEWIGWIAYRLIS